MTHRLLSLRTLLAVALLGALCGCAESKIQCLGENQKPVDWWIMLKYPILSGNSDPNAAAGYGYAYCDNTSPTLKPTGLGLQSNLNGSLGATLQQVYSSGSNVAFLMYDDQWPDGSEHDSFGHTKGVTAFDSSTGFWLIHSVPRFPPAYPGPYPGFPSNEATYGQSFLCMSYATAVNMEAIGNNFLLNKPAVFSSSVPSSFSSVAPSWQQVINNKFVTTTPGTNATVLKSLAGTSFHTFAKNAKWNQSLYEDLVQPTLQINAAWETWQNGNNGDKMPSFCQPQYTWDSMNISQVSLNSNLVWTETKDHSKWGVSTTGTKYVCIGDINRQWSQNQRGGGTACISQSTVWSSFSSMVSQCYCCSSSSSSSSLLQQQAQTAHMRVV